jgi:hypothetical protein
MPADVLLRVAGLFDMQGWQKTATTATAVKQQQQQRGTTRANAAGNRLILKLTYCG